MLSLSCSTTDPISVKVGVFGGSLSSARESEMGKNIWRKKLNIEVVTHGLGSAGFTDTAKQKKSVPLQIEDAPPYDIYVLWASTNDVRSGSVGDLESTDPSTQSGGIRESVSIIRKKNENAQILFFCSLPVFYDSRNSLIPFVEGQKSICKYLDIPYLDQFIFFNIDIYEDYYRDDKTHLTEAGYAFIAPLQVEFIRKNIDWTVFNR